MRELARSISHNPKYAKAFEWGKLITITGGTQVLVQLTGFLTGILIIRLLPTKEYAFYTLANTMLGTMTVLADSGIANGVMSQGGKVWQDKTKLGSVIATGLNLRRRLGIISLCVTAPVLIYLLLQHGASLLTTFLIVLTIIPAFFAALSDSLLEVAPKLHQDIKPLQRNGAEVSLGRLALSGLLLVVFPFTAVALIANGVPRIYGNLKLRKLSLKFTDEDRQVDPEVEKEIIKGVKRVMPNVIYYCLSSQLTIWLISLFGTTASISQIGAMGRLAMLFNLFAVLFTTLVVPRFSRIDPAKKSLLKPFLLIQATTISISVIILLGVWLFSDEILWILGKNYSGLTYELLLIAVTNCINLSLGVCSQLVQNRGWFLKPYFLIGLNFTSTVVSLTIFNMSSLVGVLYFNMVVVSLHYIMLLIYALIKITKTNKSIEITE